MTVLTGLLIPVAVWVAAALAVLGTLAVAAPGPQPLRGGRSEATRTRA